MQMQWYFECVSQLYKNIFIDFYDKLAKSIQQVIRQLINFMSEIRKKYTN